jgi:glycosyltransferase involved in cell wall biosynthesis
MLGAIVVSEDSKRYLEYMFPALPVHRVRLCINPSLFFPAPKKRQIAVMPRKNMEDLKQVLNALALRGALDGWQVVAIDGFTEAQTAAALRDSAVYLSTSSPEGFGLSPCEALACGCEVIGYHGEGGKEFLLPEFSYPIQVGDIIGFAQTAERVLWDYKGVNEKGAAFVRENYSQERERETIVGAWENILSSSCSEPDEGVEVISTTSNPGGAPSMLARRWRKTTARNTSGPSIEMSDALQA